MRSERMSWPTTMRNGAVSTNRGVFPLVSTLPRLPLAIPDEILDYYGWVFCQGGFLNLQMTFEQFLAVVAAVSPSGLVPEYEDAGGASLSE